MFHVALLACPILGGKPCLPVEIKPLLAAYTLARKLWLYNAMSGHTFIFKFILHLHGIFWDKQILIAKRITTRAL